jgi:hypothetical protein
VSDQNQRPTSGHNNRAIRLLFDFFCAAMVLAMLVLRRNDNCLLLYHACYIMIAFASIGICDLKAHNKRK